MNKILTFFYRLSGADYNVIRYCTTATKNRYRNLALALFLTVGLAFIGGYDVASQFTENRTITIAVGIAWALATFSFDYFLINGGPTRGLFRWIRVIVGLSNIGITVIALFILLNQATIDSQIRLRNSEAIQKLDQSYAEGKKTRYNAVTERRAKAEQYYADIVVPEARNGYPGPKYENKKAFYDAMITSVNDEIKRLDELETPLANAYQAQRGALEAVQSNTVFEKVKLLPGVMMQGGWLVIVLAILLFVFLSYIELQAISMKFAIGDDDEYQQAAKLFEEQNAGLLSAGVAREIDRKRTAEELRTANDRLEAENRRHELFLQRMDDTVVREAQLRGRKEIFERKGYRTAAEMCDRELRNINNGRTAEKPSDSRTEDTGRGEVDPSILHCTEPMLKVVEGLVSDESDLPLERRAFDWIVENIKYDESHGKFFYRTARETFNDGHGICGELSVLYIAFLKACNISADFVNVIRDYSGDEVKHACVRVSTESGSFLSDPAYRRFTVEHKEWEVWDYAKLVEAYGYLNR